MPPKARKNGDIAESALKPDKKRNKTVPKAPENNKGEVKIQSSRSMSKTEESIYAKEPEKNICNPLQYKLDQAKTIIPKKIMEKFSSKLKNFEIQQESKMQQTELRANKLALFVGGVDQILLKLTHKVCNKVELK